MHHGLDDPGKVHSNVVSLLAIAGLLISNPLSTAAIICWHSIYIPTSNRLTHVFRPRDLPFQPTHLPNLGFGNPTTVSSLSSLLTIWLLTNCFPPSVFLSVQVVYAVGDRLLSSSRSIFVLLTLRQNNIKNAPTRFALHTSTRPPTTYSPPFLILTLNFAYLRLLSSRADARRLPSTSLRFFLTPLILWSLRTWHVLRPR